MSCEQNARTVLAYLESEETVLKRLKEVLESQLLRLQIDEMNLRAYQNRKSKKKTVLKRGIKVKKEPPVKTEFKSPKKKASSSVEILDLKPLHLGPISKSKRTDEELLLEPCLLDPFSGTKRTEELPEILLERSRIDPFSNSKTNGEILELYPSSEENSMANSENSSA